MKRLIFALAGFFFLLTSCTTIELSESDAFDVKRTIYPQDFANSPYQLTRHTLQSGAYPLESWWITQPNARGTVLYFGGNGFVMAMGHNIIHSILQQQMNLLVFNYRGYGRNKGEPSVAGLKTDGNAAYQFLTDSLGVPPGKIIVHGHSLGSFVATHIATNHPVAGLVLQSPLTNAQDMTEALVPSLLRPLIRFDIAPELQAEDNLAAITKVHTPLLVTCGTDDKITPQVMAEKLYETATTKNKQLKLIEGGGHNNLNTMPAYQQALRKFYRKATQE